MRRPLTMASGSERPLANENDAMLTRRLEEVRQRQLQQREQEIRIAANKALSVTEVAQDRLRDLERLQRLVPIILPRETPEQRKETITQIGRIYAQSRLPTEALIYMARHDVEGVKRTVPPHGAYLFDFEGPEGTREQLERDLQEENYFAIGLVDPTEENRLVAYSTGYYPYSEQGRWGTMEKDPRQEGDDMQLCGYDWHISEHLRRITFLDRHQRLDWLGANKRYVIGYDTIGVEIVDAAGNPVRGRGIGKRMMYETCLFLIQQLMEKQYDIDQLVITSYRFWNLSLRLPDNTVDYWAFSDRYARNLASGKLFKGFHPLGSHEDKNCLIRTDMDFRTQNEQVIVERRHPASGPLQYEVLWFDEYARLTHATQAFRDELDLIATKCDVEEYNPHTDIRQVLSETK